MDPYIYPFIMVAVFFWQRRNVLTRVVDWKSQQTKINKNVVFDLDLGTFKMPPTKKNTHHPTSASSKKIIKSKPDLESLEIDDSAAGQTCDHLERGVLKKKIALHTTET